MPITATASLTYEIQTVTIDGTGACTVLLAVTLGGQRLQGVQAQLDAAACAPIWAGVPPPNTPRWPDLKARLYALLQAQGVIPG